MSSQLHEAHERGHGEDIFGVCGNSWRGVLTGLAGQAYVGFRRGTEPQRARPLRCEAAPPKPGRPSRVLPGRVPRSGPVTASLWLGPSPRPLPWPNRGLRALTWRASRARPSRHSGARLRGIQELGAPPARHPERRGGGGSRRQGGWSRLVQRASVRATLASSKYSRGRQASTRSVRGGGREPRSRAAS